MADANPAKTAHDTFAASLVGASPALDTAIADLTTATTTAELAAALATFARLDKPGFPDDLPAGRYFDGTFFAVKTRSRLAVRQIHHLPSHTHDLMSALDEERRAAGDRARMLADLDDEKRGPGQPAIGRPIPVRLPEWLITALDKDAEEAGTSRARLIRDLITEARAARRAAKTEA